MAIKISMSTRQWGSGIGPMERMLNHLVKEAQDSSSWSPAVDIFETADSVVLVAETAGVRRKDLKVLIDGDVVRIYGRREATCCKGGGRYHRMEIDTGAFTRSFRIPVRFVSKKVRAQVEDGLLYIVLPKARSQSK
jgi:HSP20 family protein